MIRYNCCSLSNIFSPLNTTKRRSLNEAGCKVLSQSHRSIESRTFMLQFLMHCLSTLLLGSIWDSCYPDIQLKYVIIILFIRVENRKAIWWVYCIASPKVQQAWVFWIEPGHHQDSDLCYPTIYLSIRSFMIAWLSSPQHPNLVLDFYYIAV